MLPFMPPFMLGPLLIAFAMELFMPFGFIGPGIWLPIVLLFIGPFMFWLMGPLNVALSMPPMPTCGPSLAVSFSSPMPLTLGQKRSSSQHICRKISSQRTISSLPSRVVVMFASSSTSARVASTNLEKAGEVQFGIRAWWRATICESADGVDMEVLNEEAYCQAER